MNGIKQDPDLKMDPDAITPSGSGYMDDEFYEDTGEMALPPKGSNKDVWVTRIPKWLYEAVRNFDELKDGSDSDQIQLGEVYALPDSGRQGGVSKTEPMRMFLHNRSLAEKQLPQAFEVQMTRASDEVLGNTYVFTEKDLPGYRPNGFGAGQRGSSQHLGVQDPKAKIQKRSKYKKAIPKQTTLVGFATREYTANPLPTKEFMEFNKARTRQAIQGRESRTNIVDNLNDHTLSQNVQKMFKTFVRPNTPAKTQINKAARIPKNELIDLLHQCFDEFAYWPMKALKAKTRQPEAYLKETLADIAALVKGGPFASTWKRTDVYNQARSSTGIEAAAPGGEDLDDDLDEEMEDVV